MTGQVSTAPKPWLSFDELLYWLDWNSQTLNRFPYLFLDPITSTSSLLHWATHTFATSVTVEGLGLAASPFLITNGLTYFVSARDNFLETLRFGQDMSWLEWLHYHAFTAQQAGRMLMYVCAGIIQAWNYASAHMPAAHTFSHFLLMMGLTIGAAVVLNGLIAGAVTLSVLNIWYQMYKAETRFKEIRTVLEGVKKDDKGRDNMTLAQAQLLFRKCKGLKSYIGYATWEGEGSYFNNLRNTLKEQWLNDSKFLGILEIQRLKERFLPESSFVVTPSTRQNVLKLLSDKLPDEYLMRYQFKKPGQTITVEGDRDEFLTRLGAAKDLTDKAKAQQFYALAAIAFGCVLMCLPCPPIQIVGGIMAGIGGVWYMSAQWQHEHEKAKHIDSYKAKTELGSIMNTVTQPVSVAFGKIIRVVDKVENQVLPD